MDLDAIRRNAEHRPVRFSFAELLDAEGRVCQDFPMGSDVTIRFRLHFDDLATQTRLAVSIRASDGLPMTLAADVDAGFVSRRDGLTRRSRSGSPTFGSIRANTG